MRIGPRLSVAAVSHVGRRQNNEVSVNGELLICDKVGSSYHELVSLGRNLTNHTLDIVYSVLLYRTAIEFVEVLTGCTNVYVEYVNLCIRIFISCEHCVLRSVHTTDF